MTLHPGQEVLLSVPDNARLHGAHATVDIPTPWGALVKTAAAATGQYRAGWAEMTPVGPTLNGHIPTPAVGYTGDVCAVCGSCRMVRTGACVTCINCGANGGCG